ncbi:Piso0_001755 [Millerozyma farinosa CBS 7064]|uniref:Piso0_001755 protein n=1 Tax=Pichia sorbitophila (strain ATCC MYA-4447 / BCRC 22081 / CBS 7064 / NBRC 10061 / NRRL Y-12695) TaxID=559304 RepID=G8YP05_PICSO|nr:Piso0_001755 [Millerozyma farinosa CBS 7064]
MLFDQYMAQTNCSLYALLAGSILLHDYFNGTWSGNHSRKALPGYYFTNCSDSDLLYLSSVEGLSAQNITDWVRESPYVDVPSIDNGDSFIALLFSISGACTASWMLTLLLYLSPNHKRKPVLTQIATVLYSVLTTLVIVQVTHSCSNQYYNNALDLRDIQKAAYFDGSYRAVAVFYQVFVHASWLQLVVYISKQSHEVYMGCFGGVVMIGFTVLHAIYEGSKDKAASKSQYEKVPLTKIRIALLVMKVVIVIWLALNLLYYTIVLKNPRKISYSKKVLPLGICCYVLLAVQVGLKIFSEKQYRTQWHWNTWISLILYLIDVSVLATAWEWVYEIEFLERRSELQDMLGRRISFNDVVSFGQDTDEIDMHRDDPLSRIIASIKSIFLRKPILKPSLRWKRKVWPTSTASSQVYDKASPDDSSFVNQPVTTSTNHSSSPYEVHLSPMNILNVSSFPDDPSDSDDPNDPNDVPTRSNNSQPRHRSSSPSGRRRSSNESPHDTHSSYTEYVESLSFSFEDEN